jgi:hypothetical protein
MRGRPGWSHNPAKAGAGASAVLTAALGMAAAGCSAGGQPAALPHATCGSATTHFLDSATQVLSAGKGSLGCFETAARHCRAASLAVTEMGTDTGTGYVFTVEPGGAGCQVTELSQPYSANFGGSQGTITTTHCRVADVTAAGVTLGCGTQDLLVPATVARL